MTPAACDADKKVSGKLQGAIQDMDSVYVIRARTGMPDRHLKLAQFRDDRLGLMPLDTHDRSGLLPGS